MSKNNSCPAKKTSIGGQALIEGIMMRGPKMTAMAVRNTEGEIVLEKWPTQTTAKGKFFKLPIIRGVFSYIDSMVFGYKCLMRSAEISGLEEAEEELRREKEAKKAKKREKKMKKMASEGDLPEDTAVEETLSAEASVDEAAVEETVTEETVTAEASEKVQNEEKQEKKGASLFSVVIMVASVVLGLALGVFLFFAVPSFLFDLFGKVVPSAVGNRWVRSIFEGVIKIGIMVGYMAAVSLMKDIRRTFMFHGAEHKTIFCYESGLELTVENVRLQKRFHPRCGTSFLIIMVLLSIFISFFIPPSIHTPLRVGIKLLSLPLIVGIGYEFIKLAGRHDNLFTKIISAPGVWLQHITTKEPDDDMIECAIVAVKEVIPDDDSDNW